MSHPLFFAALPLLLAGAVLASTDVPLGMNRFASDAYRQLAHNDSNLVLSPFSISTALSMLLTGARGKTADGIAAALRQPGYGSDYAAAVASLAHELEKSANAPGNQLSIANALWLRKDVQLSPAFEQTIRQVYQAPLDCLDFATKPEQARAAINSWTARHTNDQIQELFAPGSIDTDTRLVLTSAIYFLGKWLFPFDPADTRLEPFHTGTSSQTDAKLMHRKANFLYGETASAQILEMKYGGSPLVFDVILPKAIDGLPAVEKSMQPETLAGWFRSLTMHQVDTALPKFRAESSFSLHEMLSRLGMADAFANDADFSGIDGQRDLKVSSVVHKAFVDVSEVGTEAAAATGVAVSRLAMMHVEQAQFRADHPFAFFIRDSQSGVILFEGRLLHP